jgi:hypothetical protein
VRDELVLQRIDSREIRARIVISATPAIDEAKATSGIKIPRPGAAQVNHGCEMLSLLEGGTADSIARQSVRHMQV